MMSVLRYQAMKNFRPYFGWVNVDTVQNTMEQSTQWGVSLCSTFPMKKHLESRNPALNIPRRHVSHLFLFSVSSVAAAGHDGILYIKN